MIALNILFSVFGILLIVVVMIAGWFVYTMRWITVRTDKDRYFSLLLNERIALRSVIQSKAKGITAILDVLAKFGFKVPIVEYKGVKVPPVCSVETMAFAHHYEPTSDDIFVATQMKCGTTWMQQIVFEILCRGEGDLTDKGYRHLYAVSPWIESKGSVSLQDAPLVGVEQKRIVKTHLDAGLCPWSPSTQYIYVARHPGACLASAKDFVTMLMGGYVMKPDEFIDWFCSDDMWWRTWADHVDGWWRMSEENENILFVHYEEMLQRPREFVEAISDFLGVKLTDEELARVVHRSSYQYMKENELVFEMSPPTPFNTGTGSFFVNGTGNRGKDLSDSDTQRVYEFCREKLATSTYPLAKYYPDIAGN